MRRPTLETLIRAIAFFLVVFPSTVRAGFDLVSPGPLAAPHAKFEGRDDCALCHEQGKQVVPARCLDCHKELKTRLDTGRGYHGRLPPEKRKCAECHPEHAGRELKLILWVRTKEKFDHAATGYVLTGKHSAVACERCHDDRLIRDPEVRAMQAQHPDSPTYLGLSTDCSACHFDEHRGLLPKDCQRCHDTADWRKTPAFRHDNTSYPLTGKHKKVSCERCHIAQSDTTTAANVFPSPLKRSFLKMKGLPFDSCEDCHKDVHEGKFGQDCRSCHTTEDWKTLVGKEPAARGFHDKTRYPLKGGHASAPCKSCHGPFAGKKARFKELPFDTCATCHPDAHVGQISSAAATPDLTCDRCHTLDSFVPVTFKRADHDRTRYPLQGAHKAVPCNLCHPKSDDVLNRVPAAVRARLKAEGRPERFSPAVFRYAKPLDACETCHADPHRGQFRRNGQAKACSVCHTVASFTELTFDHNRDSRYPLTGKHAKAPCEGCHRPEGTTPAVYRGLTNTCADCHDDVHVGQFAKRGSCGDCHSTEAFRGKSAFDHNNLRFTTFALEGKHVPVLCERCHPAIEVASGLKLVRYKNLPTTCEGCHADRHKGRFQGYEPSGGTRSGSAACIECHTVAGWAPAGFNHGKTGFELKGAHARARCRTCHPDGVFEKRADRSCRSCHTDVHAGKLGSLCERCHDETGWRGTFTVDAHRATAFPLTGRHALIPCEECHREVRERTFTRVAVQCVTCHEADFQGTAGKAVDHMVLGFGTSCRQCHNPERWAPAHFAGHDTCFPIAHGAHGRFTCADCHSSISGLAITGACSTGTATCTGCHTGTHSQSRMDSQHSDVPGYQYKDRKCYECHRPGRGG